MSLFSLMNKSIQHDQCSLRTNDSLKVDSLYWIKTIVWSILPDSYTNEQVLFTELKTLKLLTFCVFSQRVVNNAHYTFCQQYFIKEKTPLVQWGKPGGSGQTWAFMKGVKIPDWSKINSLSWGLTFTLAKARGLALTWRKAPLMVLTFRPFEVYWAYWSLW